MKSRQISVNLACFVTELASCRILSVEDCWLRTGIAGVSADARAKITVRNNGFVRTRVVHGGAVLIYFVATNSSFNLLPNVRRSDTST